MSGFSSWRIWHLDLGDGVPGVQSAGGAGGLYVVLWYSGVPLGHRAIPAALLPAPAPLIAQWVAEEIAPAVGVRLFERGFEAPLPNVSPKSGQEPRPDLTTLLAHEKPLSRLREKRSAGVGEQPSPGRTSVVICTRDRPEQLERCLGSLRNQSRLPHEVLVVDNASRSDTTRLLVEREPGVRYLLEPLPGLDVARNAGVRHTTGEIVAFADDDVTVHPDWIARLEQGFVDPLVMAVTGLVLPAELETEAQWLFETCWGFNRGYRVRSFDRRFFAETRRLGVPVWEIGAGANMAFRREIFRRTGGFDERLDVGAAGCSGDSELWYRVLAEGFSCRYEPAAVVYHRHRRHDGDLDRQLYYYMRGHVAALLIQFEKYRHWGNLRRLCLMLPKYYLKLLVRGALTGFRRRYRTLGSEVAGCVSGIFFYLAHRRAQMATPATPPRVSS